MAKPFIEDCFIGNYPETQGFGGNAQAYAKFGLKGHNGIDFGIPSNTMVISSTQGQIIKVASDPNGYGNFVEILDDNQWCMTLYGHLDHATIKVGDRVVVGQLIGYSDNTGNSTGPHLHFGFGLTDKNGVRLNQDNGYSGWIDPNIYANWIITNPSQPTIPLPQTSDQVCMPKSQAEDFNRVKDGWNQVRTKLNVEDSVTVVLAEIEKLISYEDKVIKSEKDLTDAQTELNMVKGQLLEEQGKNTKQAEQVTRLVQQANDLQGKYTESTKNYEKAMEKIGELEKQLTNGESGITLIIKGIMKLIGR